MSFKKYLSAKIVQLNNNQLRDYQIDKQLSQMSQHPIYPSQQIQSESNFFPLGNDFFQSNYASNFSQASFHSNLNLKIENRNQTIFNNNIFQKKYCQKQDNGDQNERGIFEIQRKRKKQKYKRSTNNSHKKFISALRRLFYSVISETQKEQFEKQYEQFKSCRTFFFIILAYMKHRFSERLLKTVTQNFQREMELKVQEYQGEAKRTKNSNLKNFREEEIIDIQYSIMSCKKYLQGYSREAVECMYKKNKTMVMKRQHFQEAVKSLYLVEKKLKQNPRSPLESPYKEDFSNSSQIQKAKKKQLKRELRKEQMIKINGDDNEKQRKSIMFRKTKDADDESSEEEEDEEEQVSKAKEDVLSTNELEILYPPLLEAIPFIKYDPFVPPFKYKRESRYRMDVREDFFGRSNYGFPKYYQKPHQFFNPYSQHSFSMGFPPVI